MFVPIIISIKSLPLDWNRQTEIVCLLNIITLLKTCRLLKINTHIYTYMVYVCALIFPHLDDVVKFSMSTIVLTYACVKFQSHHVAQAVFIIMLVINGNRIFSYLNVLIPCLEPSLGT